MLVTFVIVFVFDTALGLAAGLSISLLLLFSIDYVFSIQNGAVIVVENELERSGVVLHVVLRNDLNFLTAGRFEESLSNLLEHKDSARPDRIDSTCNERAFYTVTSTLDKLLIRNQRPPGYDLMENRHHLSRLKVLVLDLIWVRLIDLTALIAIEETARNVRSQGCLMIVINVTNMIAKMLRKYGFHNDRLHEVMEHDYVHHYYSFVGGIIPFNALDVRPTSAPVDEESGLVINSRHDGTELHGATFAEEEAKDMILEMKLMLERKEPEEEKVKEV